MATASRTLIIEENCLCSICLDVFKEPVSIPCGHNFCLNCIKEYWDKTELTLFHCPLCKEKFFSKPMLRVNTLIAGIAEGFKQSVEDRASGSPAETGNRNVLCDRCTGEKLAAVKSCLVCFMSFCDSHLEPHQRIPAMKRHKLIHPVENLENRMCQTHDEPLELFCKVDQMFVCESCKDSDHKTHKIVSVEEEAQVRRALLGIEKEGMDQMIQVRQQKIQEIQQSVEACRENAMTALSHNQHVLTAVVDYIKRSQAELKEVIETKQKKIETETKGFIKELEEEIMQISQKSSKLNQVSIKDDAFMCLENLLSLTITAPQVKDWSDVTINSDEFTEQGAIARLETTVRREIRTLCDPDLKEMQQHAVDVTLDPDTANSHLYISSDGKQVTHGDRKRNVRNKPERFEHVPNVLAKEGFSTGKFYYEVQVQDKTNWDLGVANQSINRKGDIRLSPKKGYWTIWLRKGNELTANASPAVKLHVREMPQKIGVFVDYELGQVSFYDVDTRACMYSFTGCDFTEKLFPFFSLCANEGGKSAASLTITSCKYNI